MSTEQSCPDRGQHDAILYTPRGMHLFESGPMIGLLEHCVCANLVGGLQDKKERPLAAATQLSASCLEEYHPSKSQLQRNKKPWFYTTHCRASRPGASSSLTFRRRMSETDSDGISTLMRRILPHGSVWTLEIVSIACRKLSNEYLGDSPVRTSSRLWDAMENIQTP